MVAVRAATLVALKTRLQQGMREVQSPSHCMLTSGKQKTVCPPQWIVHLFINPFRFQIVQPVALLYHFLIVQLKAITFS